MSRSYRKISCGKIRGLGVEYKDALGYADLSIPHYNRIRVKERSAIHKEYTNPEYGDAVFPKHRGLDRSSWFSTPRWHPLIKKHIRKQFINEIKTIIKDWDSEPIDVLKYLSKYGIIEQMVRYKFRKIISK